MRSSRPRRPRRPQRRTRARSTTTRRGRCSKMTEAEAADKAVQELYAIAEEIYEELKDGQIPKMKIPLRTKANIKFDPKHSVWKYGKLTGVRSAKKMKGALMLLRTMYVLEFIRDMIEHKKSSTLREMYYISEGWDLAKFHSQDESNLLAEDLEVITNLLREDFKLRPEESGASVIGNLTIEEATRNGERRRINCRDDVGDAGYTIPYYVEKDKIKLHSVDAKFVLAIETGGMFDRLVENGFDEGGKGAPLTLKGRLGALNAELTDPRFATDFWRTEINTMLQINTKAEQQALAKYGLDYVTDTYLPEKLGEIGLM